MANNLQFFFKWVLAIRRYVDRGESSLEDGPGTNFCKACKVLFLLQESAASASSPDGLERSSKISARFVASFVQGFSFVQQGGWCVATALNQRDSGSHLIPFEVIFQLKTGPFIWVFGKAWEPQTWVKSTSHWSSFTTSVIRISDA